ncbi:Elongation factor Tu GTP binding domain protein [Trichostrongylus colubriformis]|uniref:Elongation factor Tu GTP binding domain protein n=1 Tax=Trichostrongylus colubriformis TaxID=6319 RepID=A0AAN8F3J3_TRICO
MELSIFVKQFLLECFLSIFLLYMHCIRLSIFCHSVYLKGKGVRALNVLCAIDSASFYVVGKLFLSMLTTYCFLDTFSAPSRACEGPLRIVINDVFKATSNQLSLSGRIESGEVDPGDKVYIMPNADAAVVKACSNDNGGSVDSCVAGDQAILTLNGAFEPDTIHAGHVIVRGGQDALMPCNRFVARIVVFDIAVPIMKGTRAELYCHSLCEPCTVVKLISSINKTNGEVIKERPRCLAKQMSGLVEIETEREVAIDTYTNCKALGRITIRAGGQTIAAGIVERKMS